MQSWVLWGREREKKKVVNSPHAQHLNHALSTTSPSCHTAWENPSCLFWRTQFATPRGINKTSVNQYATDKLGFFFFNILWKKWLPEGLKMLLRNPEIAAQPFYLTDRSTSTVLVLSCTWSFPQSRVRVPQCRNNSFAPFTQRCSCSTELLSASFAACVPFPTVRL